MSYFRLKLDCIYDWLDLLYPESYMDAIGATGEPEVGVETSYIFPLYS